MKILTKQGFKEFQGLKKSKNYGLEILFSNGKKIICSEKHRFISNNQEIFANTLDSGSIIFDFKGNPLKIIEISPTKEKVEFIDILGTENHTYIAENIEHHNCDFLGSTYTVIDSEVLKKLYTKILNITPLKLELGGKLRIYEEPKPKMNYIIGVDPSKGSGKHDAAIQVLKVHSINPDLKTIQVASFSDNVTDPYAISQIVNRLSIYYNNAQIFCEGNGEGSATVNHLQYTFQNTNLYCEAGKNHLGLVATHQSKSKAVSMMKRMIDNDFLKIQDIQTLNQLSIFVEDGSGKTHGQNGLPDDLVSALYWACYAFTIDTNWEDVINVFKKTSKEEDEGYWGILSDINDFDNDVIDFWKNF